MKLPRRKFLQLATGAAAMPAVSRIARAQAYPSRPVRVIVGFAPAGATDIFTRLISQWLSERLGQQFVVENRPGAATNLAAEAVVRSPPDGYTLLGFDVAAAVNATLYDKLNFNFVRDIAPIAGIARVPQIMTVDPSVPARTLPEFISYAKANPGKIAMATAGNGSPMHTAGELFKMMGGVDLVHVPYRGAGPALIDLLSGQVQVAFVTAAASMEYIRAGRLRALAVTSTMRVEALSDIPTVNDFVPGYEANYWVGFGAPKSTPAGIIGQLNMEINAGLADARLKTRLADLGGTTLPGSPADFSKRGPAAPLGGQRVPSINLAYVDFSGRRPSDAADRLKFDDFAVATHRIRPIHPPAAPLSELSMSM
jgi:tripartite-type tricarboxylate transporter receptor subunit TctC